MTPDQEARYQRNLTALAERFPDLSEVVLRLPPAASRLIGTEEAGDLNLDLGHAPLYAVGAGSAAEEQLAAYRKHPQRFYMEAPERHPVPYQKQHHVSEALHHYFEGRPLPAVPLHPVPEGGFLLVYGIGLGLFLPTLFRETPARHVILIEEHLEFFRHSLALVDWSTLIEDLVAEGRTLHFVFGGDPPVVASRVHWYMRGVGFGLLDGSYLYRHYQSTLLDLAYQDFVEKLSMLPISIGFFEDELTMLANCTENLLGCEFQFLEVRLRLEKDVPAIIVGSGPSLDRMIDHLKRLAGQAVIFSCGTALQPLLRAGIRPDFHCELENTPSSVTHIARAAEEFTLDGITLLASTTVHPDMPHRFGDRILYFRDSVASTPLWCPGEIGIHGTAPTCTNLALRVALVLAFRDIYLFGVDLGTRDARQHHAKNAFYFDRPDWLQSQETDPNKVMTIELPGNFGGKAYTNIILQWARMMMVQTIEAFSFARIFNCSDGASVPGTLPKLAQGIRLSVPPGRKAVILARMRRELDSKGPGDMVPLDRLKEARGAFARHYAAMRQEIADALRQREAFIPVYERLERLLEPQGENPFQRLLRSVNIGMMMMCFQIGYYYYRRVEPTEQPAVMEQFLGALSDSLATMAAETDELMGRLEAMPRP